VTVQHLYESSSEGGQSDESISICEEDSKRRDDTYKFLVGGAVAAGFEDEAD